MIYRNYAHLRYKLYLTRFDYHGSFTMWKDDWHSNVAHTAWDVSLSFAGLASSFQARDAILFHPRFPVEYTNYIPAAPFHQNYNTCGIKTFISVNIKSRIINWWGFVNDCRLVSVQILEATITVKNGYGGWAMVISSYLSIHISHSPYLVSQLC